MTERNKPDFAQKPGFKVSETAIREHRKHKNPNPLFGFGGDPKFLPNDKPDRLLYWLEKFVADSDLGPVQQKMFIAHANQLAQMPDGDDEPTATHIAAFKKIATAARGLRGGMNVLSKEQCEVLVTYTLDAWRAQQAPVPTYVEERVADLGPGGLLDETMARDFLTDAWEAVSTLLAASEHARSQIKAEASTTGKPKQDRARELVADLARFHISISGSAPPEDKAGWFANFVRRLGAHLGLHVDGERAQKIKGQPFIGPILLKTAISMAKESAAIAAAVKAEFHANHCFPHEWPMPLNPPVPQNCEKCGAGLNGAPDR